MLVMMAFTLFLSVARSEVCSCQFPYKRGMQLSTLPQGCQALVSGGGVAVTCESPWLFDCLLCEQLCRQVEREISALRPFTVCFPECRQLIPKSAIRRTTSTCDFALVVKKKNIDIVYMQFVIVIIFFFFRVQNAISAVWIIRPVVILMAKVRASCNAMNIIRW